MKKEKKIIDKQYKGSTSAEAKTVIKIAIGVIIFFAIVYFITALLTGSIKLKREKEKETKIQYSEILAEQTFKQQKDEYYVIYYNFNNNDAGYIEIITNGLQGTKYKVDLDKNFNKNYISEKVNENPKNITDLKVKNPTLIKVKNKKIVKVVTGITNIKQYISKK